MKGAWPIILATGLLAACAATHEPLPITPSTEVKGAAVARVPLAVPGMAPAPQIASPPAAAVPPAGAPPTAVALPPGALYVCVSESAAQRQQTVIEFAPKVAAICKRHPEMGPCQYERDICRRSGGRVYAANGQEITRQIEDEYDRKVLRVRFRAN